MQSVANEKKTKGHDFVSNVETIFYISFFRTVDHVNDHNIVIIIVLNIHENTKRHHNYNKNQRTSIVTFKKLHLVMKFSSCLAYLIMFEGKGAKSVFF